MVEKWPKQISKFGRKFKGVKMARYLVLSSKSSKCLVLKGFKEILKI